MRNDVLLINLWNTLKYFGNFVPHENIGLAYIIKYMRDRKIECDLYDPVYDDIDRIKSDLSKMSKKYVLIGLSLHENNYKMIGKIMPILRVCFPGVHITFGGLFATFHSEKLLSDEFPPDSIIRGEGEESFHILYGLLHEDQDAWHKCQALCYNRDGRYIENEVGKRLDFASIGKPDRVFVERYKLQKIHVNTTRGCSKCCSFCSAVRFTTLQKGDGITLRPAEDVAEEVIEIYEKYYPFRKIEFVDDNFLANEQCKKRAWGFANILIERGYKIPFRIDACIEDIEFDLFSLLKKAGLEEVLVGVESFSDRILKIYNKRITSAQISQALDILNKLEIHTRLAWIMFNPYITLDDIRINLNFLRDVKLFWFFTDLVGSLRLQLGTPLTERVRKDNLLLEAFPYPGYRYQLNEVEVFYKAVMTEKFKRILMTCHSLTFTLWQHTESEKYNQYIDLRKYFTNYMLSILEMINKTGNVDGALRCEAEDQFIKNVIIKINKLRN